MGTPKHYGCCVAIDLSGNHDILADREAILMNAIELTVKAEADAMALYSECCGKNKPCLGKKMFLSIVEDEQHLNDRRQHALGMKHDSFVYTRRTLS